MLRAERRARARRTVKPPTIRAAESEDVKAIEDLLERNTLPSGGVEKRLETTLVAIDGGRIVGTAAVELCADGALLRSVAVTGDTRSTGVGSAMVAAALDVASARAAGDVFLLTTTADGYFPRFGFERIGRDAVPAGVRASEEFTSACPASAVVMRRRRDASRS